MASALLPYASPGGSEVGTAVAQQELADLLRAAHPLRDGKLEDCAEAFTVVLNRGVDLDDGWQAWRLGLNPGHAARDGMPVHSQRRGHLCSLSHSGQGVPDLSTTPPCSAITSDPFGRMGQRLSNAISGIVRDFSQVAMAADATTILTGAIRP